MTMKTSSFSEISGISGISRRSFLRGAAASTAGLLWLKNSWAQSAPAFGSAQRLLVLYAAGGLRSAPLFHANVAKQHNPFGQVSPLTGVEWAPGTILGTEPIPLYGFGQETMLPPVPAIARDITVVAGVDHDPDSNNPTIDHGSGDLMLATGTGAPDGSGLLARIFRDHPGYKDGSIKLPPFDIGLSSFARGTGELAGYRPVSIQSAAEFTGRSATSGREERAIWARMLREKRDEKFIAARSPHVKPYLTAARDAKINAREYTTVLHNPALDLMGRPDAELGGLTNLQLIETLNGFPQQGQWGLEVAFALRAMQLGVPAVSVQRYLYDTHSEEQTSLPIDAGDLGRQIAGLHFLLHRLRDSDGNALWDRTVVLVVSEFSRDNTDPATGFNTGNGSDHQGTPASRNQSWPIFGGPVAGGRKIGGLDPNTLVATGGRAIEANAVMASVLSLLGIDPSAHFGSAPVAALLERR